MNENESGPFGRLAIKRAVKPKLFAFSNAGDDPLKALYNQTRLSDSVLHLLHRSGQQAEVLFSRQSSRDDMTPRQFAVLLTVDANEDISQTGLVDATGIDRSTLADVVRRLVTRGWLTRKRTRQDARMYAVRLTAKGKAALEAAKPSAKRADEIVLGTLPLRARQEFIETLTKVVEAMDAMVANHERAPIERAA